MKYLWIILFVTSSLPIRSMEIPQAKRKLECEFLQAARMQDFAALDACLTQGANPNTLDVYGRNALHLLFSLPERKITENFLNYHIPYDQLSRFVPLIDVTTQDKLVGNTPLHNLLELIHASCRNDKYHRSWECTALISRILEKAPQLILILNNLNYIPFDLLSHNAQSPNGVPELENILRPKKFPIETYVFPRIAKAARISQCKSIEPLLESFSSRQILIDTLCAVKRNYFLHFHYGTPSGDIKKVGLLLVNFLRIRDYFSTQLMSLGIWQEELAHEMAWTVTQPQPFTTHDKEALTAMFIK